jgi:2-oxo-4-hydroxy-4-carboxy-5-ureidoimidazoline decarboxylase
MAVSTLEVTAIELEQCCASRRWVEQIMVGRPYDTFVSLIAESDQALASLEWSDVIEALAAHPRIGERSAGTGRESAWSREEQAGAADLDAQVQRSLIAGNLAYEELFGQVFLICATGLSAAEMLAALESRLGNDQEAEEKVVRRELAAIVRLRLAKAFG